MVGEVTWFSEWAKCLPEILDCQQEKLLCVKNPVPLRRKANQRLSEAKCLLFSELLVRSVLAKKNVHFVSRLVSGTSPPLMAENISVYGFADSRSASCSMESQGVTF